MNKKMWTALMYGWLTILFLVLTSSALLALIIKFGQITAFTLSYVTLIIGLVTLFIGGLIAGLKGKSNGWVLGLFTGCGFTLLTILIQYLGFDMLFSMKQLVFHLTYILCAVIGSVIGVNLVVNNNKQAT